MIKFPRTDEDVVVLSGPVWNDVANALEWAYGISVAAPLQLFDTPSGPLLGLRDSSYRIVRMKVTNPTAGTDVVLAKYWDGTTATGDDIPVRVYYNRAVNEEIYALVPAGGTDALYNGLPVTWLEMWKPPAPQYQYMMFQAVAQGVMGWDFSQAHPVP